MTRYEIIETLKKGIDLLEQQSALQKEIDKTFALIGVELCGRCGTLEKGMSAAAEKTIQIYTGICQLAEALGFGLYHPSIAKGSEPKQNQIAFAFGNYELFEFIKENENA